MCIFQGSTCTTLSPEDKIHSRAPSAGGYNVTWTDVQLAASLHGTVSGRYLLEHGSAWPYLTFGLIFWWKFKEWYRRNSLRHHVEVLLVLSRSRLTMVCNTFKTRTGIQMFKLLFGTPCASVARLSLQLEIWQIHSVPNGTTSPRLRCSHSNLSRVATWCAMVVCRDFRIVQWIEREIFAG